MPRVLRAGKGNGMAKDEARSFAVFITRVGDGDANAELSAELHTLTQAVTADAAARNQISKGELTLKLTVSVDPRGVAGITWDCKRKDPKVRRAAGVMWVSRNGNLVAENPRQQSLPLREVTRQQEAIEIDVETGEVHAAREV